MINLYRSRMYCSSRACCMNCGWRNLIFSRFRQLKRILITRQFVPFCIIYLGISVCLIKSPRIAFNRKNYYSVLFRYIRKRLIGKVLNRMRNNDHLHDVESFVVLPPTRYTCVTGWNTNDKIAEKDLRVFYRPLQKMAVSLKEEDEPICLQP